MNGFFRYLIPVLALLLGSTPLRAQTVDYIYSVYIDGDLNAATGCVVNGPGGQTMPGVDFRIQADVGDTPPRVLAARYSLCSGGSFTSGSPLRGNYPLGLNNGLAGADVIELALRRVQQDMNSTIRVGFGAQTVSGSEDVLLTVDGTPGGAPIIVGLPARFIPLLSPWQLALLAGLLAGIAAWTLHRHPQVARVLFVVSGLSVAYAAYAANFNVDGQVSDWAGLSPQGNDPTGDAVPPQTASDLVAGWIAEEAGVLYFRLDVVDAENQPPIANADAYSTLEDTALTVPAPGVLGNDSDPDGDPITAQLATNSTRGNTVLNADGSFTYTPNANLNGPDSFTYRANDGQSSSTVPAVVTISVTPVNDAPSFTRGADQTVNEDAGPQSVPNWATAIDDGDPEAAQNLSFTITNNTNAALFSTAPAVSAAGTLTYTPAANANGTATITLRLDDDGGTANGGVSQSAAQTFVITVTAVNDAPVFTPGANVTVLEDAGAQTIAPWATAIGDGDPELTQVLSFQANVTGTTGNLAFTAAPAINATTGNLTFTATANTAGVATVSVTLTDDGSNLPPNVNISAAQTFTITVTGINDAPLFTPGGNQTVNEDAGAQTVTGWATAIDDGDGDVVQVLSFNVSNNNNALFSTQPAISPTGVLSYTPAADANGTATVQVQLMDDGGTANGGVNVSATVNFTITVTAVNDAPSFTRGADQTVAEDAGPQTVNPWATAISAGPPDEAGQTLSFNITSNTNAALFGTAPAVSPTGVLTYTPALNASGSATLTLTLSDNGSNTPPNVNTSAAQTFTITVTAVNDAPINTVPGAQATGDTTPLVFSTANTNAISIADVDAAAGLLQLTLSTGAAGNGTLTLSNPGSVLATLTGNGTETVIATGTLTNLNLALNGPSGSLTYTPVAGTTATRTLSVTTDDQGNTGAGGAQTDTDTININVDSAPVVSATPAAGTIANNAAFVINFSESVTVSPGGVSLSCGGGPNLFTGGTTGAGISVLNPTYAAPLPAGACVLTVLAANVTDTDAIDPPNNPVADFTRNYTVDAAPALVSATPTAAAVVAADTNVSFTFDEAVTGAAGAITLDCGGPIAGTLSGSGTATLSFDPTVDLPFGSSCTATAVAAQISDVDSADPPQNPAGNTVRNFTVDAEPAVTGGTPAAAATNVATNTVVTFTFSENVDAAGGAITLNCGGSISGVVSGSGTSTLSFTPSSALPPNTSCTATAVAANITDSDAVDPPNVLPANVSRSFTTDAAPAVTTTSPTDGSINAPINGVITVNFSEPVTFSGASFTLECPSATPRAFNVAGSGTATATLTPTANLPINTLCVVTVLAAGIDDVDAGDPPANLAANFVFSFTTVNDNPPSVATAEVEIGGAFTALPLGPGVASDSNTQIRLTFSEVVNPTGVWAQLLCTISGSRTVGSGLGVTVLDPVFVLSPAVNLSPGDACTLTVFANQVVDDDGIDPPDQMTANFVATFNVDNAPSVTSTTPANGSTNVASNTTLTINFSEAVNVGATGVTLNCGAAVTFNAGVLPATGVTSLVLTPSAALPSGATCNGSVLAAQVTDADAADPPDQMLANFSFSFTTDAEPTVTTVTPAAAAVVPTSQTITVNFSENVDLTATAFTLECPAASPIAFTGVPALPATATNTITLTPTGGLPAGASCVFTVVANQVSDSDGNDPPNLMAVNFVRNFSVDAAPAVTTTTPANGATAVDPTTNITVNFSEPVTFDTTANAANTSFDLECPIGTPADFTVVTVSPAASVVLDPLDNAVAGSTCTLSVRAAGIADADAVDPPNNMAADFTASFTYAAVANNDAYNVTPHLTLGIGAATPQGGGVLVNDVLGAGVITGFGFSPSCTGTAPSAQLDAGAANGRLTLNADGSFSYEPPATVAANVTRTFCYSVTGGDTANVVFTHQATELVWFVDAGAAPAGTGTQARPFQTLSDAVAVDTINDTIHLAFNASSYTGGITLLNGERLIGTGAAGTLETHSGITPVAGSAFPALGGSAPAITCTDVNCITLASGNMLRGFVVGDSGNAGTDIAGTNFGTLTLSELTLTGIGRALNLDTGTVNGTFADINVTAGNNEGLLVNAVGGTWGVTAAVDIGNVSGTAVNLTAMPAGGGVTLTGGLNVNKTSTGAGVNLNANVSPVNLGAVSITTGAGTALTINSSAGITTTTGGALAATGGAALASSASSLAITLGGAASTNSPTQGISLSSITGTVTIGNGGNISGSGGTAFLASGSMGGGVSYGGNVSKTSAGVLVSVTGAGSGDVTLSGSLSCTTSCGTGAGNFGLRVANRTGGTLLFSGTPKTFSSSAANAGISLDTNAGATINFSGGSLAITTTSGAAFSATGGGTVTVQGTANTLVTTTGAAAVVTGTTIGATGMTFESINSPTASATQVITLTGTGAGPFTVTGTGAAGTGGTIDNKTDDAIRLDTVGGLVTLNRMIIEDIGDMAGASQTVSGHDAIQGLNVNGGLSLTGTTIRRISDQAIHGGNHLLPAASTVWNGLTLDGVTIEDTNRFHIASRGDANNEGSVRIVGLRGTVSVTNSLFQRGGEFLDIFATAGTLNMTVTNNDFLGAYKEFAAGDNSPIASVGGHCVDVTVQGVAVANVTVGDRTVAANGNDFLNCRLGSVRLVKDTGSSGDADFIVARNTFTVNDGSSGFFCSPACVRADFDFPQGGLLHWQLGSGSVDSVVENNTFTDVTNASGGVGQMTLIAEGGAHNALVQNNAFIRPGNAPWFVLSRNFAASNMRLRAIGNTVTGGPSLCTLDTSCAGGYQTPGLRTLFDTNTGGIMDLTMDNNQFAGHDQGFDPGETVEVRGLAPGGGTVCVNWNNNRAEDGYSLEESVGTMSVVGAGTCSVGAPSVDCQTVLGNRGNRGGANNVNTNPPFVRVTPNALTVTGTACAVPTGGPF